eukprot:5210989-Pyramimonas_sp.AAC.1
MLNSSVIGSSSGGTHSSLGTSQDGTEMQCVTYTSGSGRTSSSGSQPAGSHATGSGPGSQPPTTTHSTLSGSLATFSGIAAPALPSV